MAKRSTCKAKSVPFTNDGLLLFKETEEKTPYNIIT